MSKIGMLMISIMVEKTTQTGPAGFWIHIIYFTHSAPALDTIALICIAFALMKSHLQEMYYADIHTVFD